MLFRSYLFFFKGCPISWHSKTHQHVTTSSNHSEYVASAKAAKEADWISKIFSQLGEPDICPIPLFGDNKGANAMVQNPVNHKGAKHVDVADHFAREQVRRGLINVPYVNTADNLADMFTKALPPCKFNVMCRRIMFK